MNRRKRFPGTAKKHSKKRKKKQHEKNELSRGTDNNCGLFILNQHKFGKIRENLTKRKPN
jgi:hypothetical protein